MRLLVESWSDRTSVVEASPEMTVAELAHKVSRLLNVPTRETRLMIHGKPGRKGRTLLEYGAQDGSLVWVDGRVKGGALLGKPVKGRSKIDFEEKFMRQREFDALNQTFQVVKAELKAKIDQEKTNSKMNRLKIQNQWRKIMRLAKVESLKKGIEILSQNHERDVDRKDAIIQMLDRDLEEAEDQFQTALRSHLQGIDALVDLQDSRLLVAECEFGKELSSLETEFNAEKAAIATQHAAETQELRDIAAGVENSEREREAEARQEHEQLREEIKNRNLDAINMLRIGLDSQIEDLEQHFETAHLNYLQTTDQRTHDFKFYTKKDQEHSKEIELKIRRIERLQASLNHWRTKLVQNAKDCAQRNSALLDEKNEVQLHFQQLKSRMNKFRQTQRKRLAALTHDSHAAKTKLTKRLELAERILTLTELARKSETREEQVAPFSLGAAEKNAKAENADAADIADAEKPPSKPQPEASLKISDDPPDETTKALQTTTLTKDGKQPETWSELDVFLKKYNKVLLDKLAVERERARLEHENADLQSILRQYFDGVSVKDAVLNSENPLLVVNGNFAHSSSPLPVREPSQAALEANHLVATSRVHTSPF